ncbi:MAG TPA: S41 family peptidase [Rhizomicrobium sp.]|nr:S41 family peptidase [Rhizomicrobium sp.]
MNRRTLLAALVATALPLPTHANECANADDLSLLIDQMAARYAYLPDRHVDLAKLRAVYLPEICLAPDPRAFLSVLERFLAEFHDHHIEANTNNGRSPQLVPTGTDLWASMTGGRAVIEQVRSQSASAKAGVRAGDEVVSIAGVSAGDAVVAHAPRCLSAPDPEAMDYTLRVLLAGTHDARRVFVVRGRDSAARTIDLPPMTREEFATPLATRSIGDVAYFRIENSLGDTALIDAFDKALATIGNARALIIDLRNTPSGGNTAVAEPVMGRFITGRPGYQRVFDPGPGKTFPKDSWVKWVRARPPTFTEPLVVLVNRWTGSMGEGMAIGLDGMKRATVVGTRMADLCGATSQFMLPKNGIGVDFPTERLYHLDGTPRETWRPPVFVDPLTATGDDPILARALKVLNT